jgi:hypothetical protein
MFESAAEGFLRVGPTVILLAGVAGGLLRAGFLKGSARWWTLSAAPLVALAGAVVLPWIAVVVLRPREEWGFLPEGTTLLLFLLIVAVYYPVLAAFGLRKLLRDDEAKPDETLRAG